MNRTAHVGNEAPAPQRSALRHRRGADRRERPDRVDHVAREDGVVVPVELVARQRDGHRQQAVLVEPGLDPSGAQRAPDQQPPGQEQDERKRDFGRDENGDRTGMRSARRHAASVEPGQPHAFGPRGPQGRRDAGDAGREDRAGQRGDQNRRVELHFLEQGQVRGHPRPRQLDGPRREQDPEQAGARGENRGLDEELPRDAPPRRTERRADRHFAAARDAARQEQRRHVRARDEQQHGGPGRQQQDAVAGTARHLLPQRHDPDFPAAVRLRVALRLSARDAVHLGLRRREAHARLQLRDDLEPGVERAAARIGRRHEPRHPEVDRVDDAGDAKLEIRLERGKPDRRRRRAEHRVAGRTDAGEIENVEIDDASHERVVRVPPGRPAPEAGAGHHGPGAAGALPCHRPLAARSAWSPRRRPNGAGTTATPSGGAPRPMRKPVGPRGHAPAAGLYSTGGDGRKLHDR